jgi:hypothetical protein
MTAINLPGNSFGIQVAEWAKKTNHRIDVSVRRITLELFSGIIAATPVDTGRARGNWQTSVGSPTSGVIDRDDLTGAAAIAEARDKMGGAGKVTYLTNNLPYIQVLEYGGYPNPPKRGTLVSRGAVVGSLGLSGFSGNISLRQSLALSSRTREPAVYEIRSSGGYSRQAPAGMVRINMARVQQIVSEALKK